MRVTFISAESDVGDGDDVERSTFVRVQRTEEMEEYQGMVPASEDDEEDEDSETDVVEGKPQQKAIETDAKYVDIDDGGGGTELQISTSQPDADSARKKKPVKSVPFDEAEGEIHDRDKHADNDRVSDDKGNISAEKSSVKPNEGEGVENHKAKAQSEALEGIKKPHDPKNTEGAPQKLSRDPTRGSLDASGRGNKEGCCWWPHRCSQTLIIQTPEIWSIW